MSDPQNHNDGSRPATRTDRLLRLLYREFLLEPELYLEAGLDTLPERLGQLIGCPAAEALVRAVERERLEALDVGRLRELLAIRDMTLIGRTAAAVAEALKQDDVSYEQCVRAALCYALAEMEAHVFSALRAAGSKRDDWAKHHFIYGLMHGLGDNRERALWELDMALAREPYEDGRLRIRDAIAALRRD